MDISEHVGLRIKELRTEKGISQETLAAKAGLDRTYITSVERGRRNISIATLKKITDSLDIRLYEFFRFTDDDQC